MRARVAIAVALAAHACLSAQPAATAGWAVGTGGATLKTTNAGGSWAAMNPTTFTLNAVQFVSIPTFVDVTVQTNPQALAIMVDGTVYVGTQSFSWLAGSSHTIATTTPQGARYVFASWSDGGAISHTVAPTVAATYTANFATQHQLAMVAGTGGTVSPPTGWQAAGSSVTITATPDPGLEFGGWTGSGVGAYSGPDNPVAVTMNAPMTQEAQFGADPTGVTEPMPVLAFALLPPSPNPSPGAVRCAFSLPEAGPVSLEVFDLRGRLVDALLDVQAPAGAHLCVWRGTDRGGAPAANEVYLVRLRSGTLQQTGRVSLVR